MQIACLHTAELHVETFAALFAAQAPGVDVSHVVRADLLARAQSEGAVRIADATAEAVADLADFDAVLCTCSTLGPLVDALHDTRLIRIDRPLMVAAAAHGARPLLAICLESTRAASLGAEFARFGRCGNDGGGLMKAGIAVLVLAYGLSQFYRAFLAVLAPDLQTDIGAMPDDLAFASGVWFIVFAVMQIPVGAALDTVGPKATAVVLFAIGAAGGAFLFSVAQTPLHVTLAMGLIGVGCSPVRTDGTRCGGLWLARNDAGSCDAVGTDCDALVGVSQEPAARRGNAAGLGA